MYFLYVQIMTSYYLIKNISGTQNIELNNYCFEHTPTESSAEGKLLYITFVNFCISRIYHINIYKTF